MDTETLGAAGEDERIRTGEECTHVALLAGEADAVVDAETTGSASSAGRSGPSPTISASNELAGRMASARASVMKSFGALSRPTDRRRGRPRS